MKRLICMLVLAMTVEGTCVSQYAEAQSGWTPNSGPTMVEARFSYYTTEPTPRRVATYLEIAALTTDATLVTKATVAVAKSAQYAMSGGGPQCADRLQAARSALESPRAEAVAHFMWDVALNGDVQTGGAGTADATIQFIVDNAIQNNAKWGTC